MCAHVPGYVTVHLPALYTIVGLLGYLFFAGGLMSETAYFGTGIVTSTLLGLHGVERRSRPMLVMNVSWLAISLVGLGRALL